MKPHWTRAWLLKLCWEQGKGARTSYQLLFFFFFGLVMTISSIDKKKKKGKLANSEWQIQFCQWSHHQWQNDSEVAFLLSSAAAPSCSALTQPAFSSGLKPKADGPCQPPQEKLPVGTSPGSLSKIVSFLHTRFIFCERKQQKKVHVNEVRTLKIWAAAASVHVNQVHNVPLEGTRDDSFPPPSPSALHSHSFKPIILVQKLRWFFYF